MRDHTIQADLDLEPALHTYWCSNARGDEESKMSFEEALNLRCYVQADFAVSKTWRGLIRRLSDKGFYLAFVGDRLVLFNKGTQLPLCTCSFVGFSFGLLQQLLGKPSIVARPASGDVGRQRALPLVA